MNLFFPLLGLGLIAGGVFAGTLQQNLSQFEKPEIDILFDKIVEKMRKFANENPIDEETLRKINEDKSETEKDKNKLPKYTLKAWTGLWVNLLAIYIGLWYDMTNSWGTRENPYLQVKEVFAKENKQKNFKKAEKSSDFEKFKKEFYDKTEIIEEIWKDIKDFIFLVKLPKFYNKSSNDDSPYENYIKAIV